MPNAALTDVELWPESYTSQSLSERLGKPLIPPDLRNVRNASLRPVRILCAYAW